jgi:hypothetical protein
LETSVEEAEDGTKSSYLLRLGVAEGVRELFERAGLGDVIRLEGRMHSSAVGRGWGEQERRAAPDVQSSLKEISLDVSRAEGHGGLASESVESVEARGLHHLLASTKRRCENLAGQLEVGRGWKDDEDVDLVDDEPGQSDSHILALADREGRRKTRGVGTGVGVVAVHPTKAEDRSAF